MTLIKIILINQSFKHNVLHRLLVAYLPMVTPSRNRKSAQCTVGVIVNDVSEWRWFSLDRESASEVVKHGDMTISIGTLLVRPLLHTGTPIHSDEDASIKYGIGPSFPQSVLSSARVTTPAGSNCRHEC